MAIIVIITKASVSSLESSCFSTYSGAPQGHHVIFPAKGPPCPLPHIYIIVIYHISIYHCCILVGTNNAATRWWQSLRNSPLPFLLSPTPLAFVIHPRPQVLYFVNFFLLADDLFHLRLMERKLCGDCRWKIRFLCIRTRFGVQAKCPTIQWHKKTNGVIVESRESMFFPTTSSMPHFESRELRCIWAPCKKVKRSYSGVGALSLASLMSQRTLVSACQLLSCLSGPPWATFAPQLNAAWITEMHRNAMSGGACFARYRRSMESQAGAGRILLHSKLSNRTFPSRICVDTWDSRPDIVSSCERLLSSYNPYFLQDPGATARRVDDNLRRRGGRAGRAGRAGRHNLESGDAMGAFDLVGECILQTATTRKAVATALTGVWFTTRDGIQRLISERNMTPATLYDFHFFEMHWNSTLWGLRRGRFESNLRSTSVILPL